MRRVHLARSYRNAVMALGPLAYWRLGEASGTVAADETGAYPGTYTGGPTLGVAGLLAGDPDTAATFGATTYVLTGTLPALLATRTLGCRVIPIADTDMIVLGCSGDAYLRRMVGGYVMMSWFDAGGTQRTLTTAAGKAPAGVATFAVGTHDGTTATLYINGTLAASDATYSCRAQPTGTTWTIARLPNGSLPATATLDEPAVWARTLAANEIARLYAIGRGF